MSLSYFACGVTWPTAALVVGLVALAVIAWAIFVFGGGELWFCFGDPPDDER